MKRLYTGFFMAAGGLLAGAERLLSNPDRYRNSKSMSPEETPVVPSTAAKSEPVVAPAVAASTPKSTERNFSIKRTKSEVGYVYWILEGYGRYKCFILCDSWDEAVAQAKVKMIEIDQPKVKVAVASSVA